MPGNNFKKGNGMTKETPFPFLVLPKGEDDTVIFDADIPAVFAVSAGNQNAGGSIMLTDKNLIFGQLFLSC